MFFDAVEVASAEVNRLQNLAAQQDSKAWLRRFNHWSDDTNRAGGKVSKSNGARRNVHCRRHERSMGCPLVPSTDQVAQNADTAWRLAAAVAGMEQKTCENLAPPSFAKFLDTVLLAKGAAGWDGWSASEAKALANYMPSIVRELHELFIRTMNGSHDHMPDDLQSAVLAWRVVGVPKRDPSESRPIAIASVFLRLAESTRRQSSCHVAASMERKRC